MSEDIRRIANILHAMASLLEKDACAAVELVPMLARACNDLDALITDVEMGRE